ncbi:MAG: LysR family transcriptional regulator [Clostridiaceae bacterium]
MNTERLFEFLVLARTLSYSQAAKKLFINQSVLSRHIQSLESELGTMLFERSTHSVVLTEAGRLLARDAVGLLAKYDAAVSRLRLPGLKEVGSIRIACAQSAVCERLVNFIRQFRTKYSEIYLDLDVLDEQLLIHEPSDYDLVFTLFDRGDGKDKPIMLENAYIAVPPGHRLMTRQAAPLRELTGERLFVAYADEVFSSFARNRQLAERFTNGRITIVRVPSVESALLMVELKAGIAIVTSSMLSSACPNVKIVGILEDDCDFQIFLHVNESHANPAAQLFVEEFNNTPNPLGRV